MIIGLIIIALLIGFDQGTKHLAKYLLEDKPGSVWIPGVLTFNYVPNDGAAWGIFSGKQFFFFLVTIIALVAFGYLFTKIDLKKKKVYTSAIILLIAGTLGNAIDRLVLGYVIDFIHIPFLTYILGIFKIPNFTFNIADLCLTVGIILLIIDVIFFESKRERNKERVSCVYDTVENKGREDDEN
ncbi:MAG: signal peptidase II [Acholeplasmataceae bacterium]|jgi:signal peptidase II